MISSSGDCQPPREFWAHPGPGASLSAALKRFPLPIGPPRHHHVWVSQSVWRDGKAAIHKRHPRFIIQGHPTKDLANAPCIYTRGRILGVRALQPLQRIDRLVDGWSSDSCEFCDQRVCTPVLPGATCRILRGRIPHRHRACDHMFVVDDMLHEVNLVAHIPLSPIPKSAIYLDRIRKQKLYRTNAFPILSPFGRG